jgi:hypothetical protein
MPRNLALTLGQKILVFGLVLQLLGPIVHAHEKGHGLSFKADGSKGSSVPLLKTTFACEPLLEKQPDLAVVKQQFEQLITSFTGFALTPEEIEKTKGLIETSIGHRAMVSRWTEAVDRYHKVKDTATTPYAKKILKAAEAALTRHFDAFVDNRLVKETDLSRLFKIYQEISRLESGRLDVGLFKIQKLIKGRYDLDQFIRCL